MLMLTGVRNIHTNSTCNWISTFIISISYPVMLLVNCFNSTFWCHVSRISVGHPRFVILSVIWSSRSEKEHSITSTQNCIHRWHKNDWLCTTNLFQLPMELNELRYMQKLWLKTYQDITWNSNIYVKLWIYRRSYC